jgi:hypothetical protein
MCLPTQTLSSPLINPIPPLFNFWEKYTFGPYILGVFSIWSLNFKSFQLSPCVFTPFSIIPLASSPLKICIRGIWKLLNGPMRVRPEYDPNPLSPNPNPLTSCRVCGSCQILPPLVAIVSGLVHSLDQSFTKIKKCILHKKFFLKFCLHPPFFINASNVNLISTPSVSNC